MSVTQSRIVSDPDNAYEYENKRLLIEKSSSPFAAKECNAGTAKQPYLEVVQSHAV